MLGVQVVEIVVARTAGRYNLRGKVNGGLVDERTLSGLARCLVLRGLYQSGADGSSDEPGNEQSGEYQQSAYQQTLAHWEVSPLDSDLRDVELVLNRGSTIL